MDMNSKNQYLQTLIQRQGYHLQPKKTKTKILNEYCNNTGMNRNYIIRKIRSGKLWPDRTKKRQRNKKVIYDKYFVDVLIKCWEMFDYPCGQRLEACLREEVDRLITFREIVCTTNIQNKLKKVSARTIDKKLKPHKEKLRLKHKYKTRNNPLLYKKIPIKLSDEWDRTKLGNIQIDSVEHCGNSAHGYYGYTISNTDISSGWWEGECCLGNSQEKVKEAINKVKKRFPLKWKEMHTDNGSEYINAHLYKYSLNTAIIFSRSRPHHKNDNCFIEQKNWTHVRRILGYYRYDSKEEIDLINSLYRNELRLYKNFFQPIIKLKSKIRIGSKIKKKYDKPKTPYKRLIESKEVSKTKKVELIKIYNSLNPAQIKRQINKKLMELYKMNKNKRAKSLKVDLSSKKKILKPTLVTFLTAQPEKISLT